MSDSKIALITGGAKRVGREICLHLAKQRYDVAIHYNGSQTEAEATAKECASFGIKTATFQGELTKAEVCSNVMRDCIEELGIPSLIIHNASRFERDTVESLSEEQLQRHMAIHCYAPLFLAQIWKAHIHKDDTQRQMILLGDGLEHWSLSPAFLSYAISKDAMHAVMKRLATALLPHIRINLVACGLTMAGDIDTPEMVERFKTIAPLQRTSSPEEICQAIDFLEKTPSITGQSIALNSAMHLSHNKSANPANTAT